MQRELCSVIVFVVLIYEPNNVEALSFQQVIEDKLNTGRFAVLLCSRTSPWNRRRRRR